MAKRTIKKTKPTSLPAVAVDPKPLPVVEDMNTEPVLERHAVFGGTRRGLLTKAEARELVEVTSGRRREWAPMPDYKSDEYKAGKREERKQDSLRQIMVANVDAPVRVNVEKDKGKSPPETLKIYPNLEAFKADHNFQDYPFVKSAGMQDETIILVRASIWVGKERPAKPAGEKGESKKELIKRMLLRPEGCTTKEVLEATGWPAVSMPGQAKMVGLQLRKVKENGVTKYWGFE
jgi:hypothetical protein